MSSAKPIALGKDEGEALWFLGSLVTIKSSGESTDGRVGVTENLSPKGGARRFMCTGGRTSGST